MNQQSILSLDKIFSKGKLTSWSFIDRRVFNHDIHTLNGELIEFGKAIPKGTKRVPKVFSPKILCGDLIPQTSWGSSLANLLTPSSWNSLRHPVIERNNGVCEFCGKYMGKSLEIHELWDYSEPPSDDVLQKQVDGNVYFGRQSLMGFVGVCKDCHACYHLGLANVQGRLEQVLQRLAVINAWTEDETDSYVQLVSERHEWLSLIHWALDLRWLADQVDGLIVSSQWKQAEDAPHVLLRDNRDYGQSVSIITGCRWHYPKETEWRFLEYSST